MSVASWGTTRHDDVITVWTTDLRRSPRKIAERVLRGGESLIDYPREHDRPGRPTRFKITRNEEAS